MALRIEKAFGVSMDTLMRMQNSYDIAQACKREGEINVAPFKGLPADTRAVFESVSRMTLIAHNR